MQLQSSICDFKEQQQTLRNWYDRAEPHDCHRSKIRCIDEKMGNKESIIHSANEVGTVNENEKRSSAEEGLAHEGPYQVEEA